MFAFAGCENPEEPILKEVSSLTFSYSFPSINQGESMTKASSNADIFAEFYAAICDGRLVAPSYDLTFTNILTGEEFQLQGMWNVRTDVKIRMGTYSVRGTATAEGAYIQDKCSIVIDDPEVVVDRDEATVTLSAAYDCALVIFYDQSIVSVVNHTGDSDTYLFDFEEYIYAFVNDKIWDGVSDSYLLGTRQNGSEFKIPTQSQPFLKGKFYVYDTTKTNSFESIFDLPGMEEGKIIINQPANEIWYTSTDGNVVTPNATDVFGANIVSNTYENGKGIIIFDGDVTEIGENAFYLCENLASITLPEGITSIGTMAMDTCTNLSEVVIPDSVVTIGDHAFNDCFNLSNVVIGENVTTISAWAFSDCVALTSVTIPDSVSIIGEGAFGACYGLERFEGSNVSADGRCLILDGVLKAFAPAGLTEYSIPEGATSIAMFTFQKLEHLTTVHFPAGLTDIGYKAFEHCYGITSISTAGSDVKIIHSDAFTDCYGLVELNLEGVEIIDMAAFVRCRSLQSVTIPQSVTLVDHYAFGECDSLTSAYFESTTPPSISSAPFSDWRDEPVLKDLYIYVPTESVEAYKSATDWDIYTDSIYPYNFE